VAGQPDLFVVCPNCESEVSPYITECPYCGTRLRKRAPKIERDGDGLRAPQPSGRDRLRRKPKAPRRPSPARRPAVPRVTSAAAGGRPWATLTIVLLSLFGFLALSFVTRGEVALRALTDETWRLATSVFVYGSSWYELACLVPIGLFAWRLELRHGPWIPIVLFLICGIGANAVAATVEPDPFLLGAPGAALGLLAAWAVPDVRRERAGIEHDGDLIGVAVLAVVVACMPLATVEASVVATATGGIAGLLIGLLLARRPVNAL
jgi:membrane associated rhomboid family serine protease